MASFDFTVNQSFLSGPGHPITIPKGQITYPTLLALGLNHSELSVILPRGERFRAGIYHGEAGYGEYYQIRFHGEDRTLPTYLRVRDKLLVFLVVAGNDSFAILENKTEN